VELELGPDLYTFMYTLLYFSIYRVLMCVTISVYITPFMDFIVQVKSFKVLEGFRDVFFLKGFQGL
jgi:hypothetical protein